MTDLTRRRFLAALMAAPCATSAPALLAGQTSVGRIEFGSQCWSAEPLWLSEIYAELVDRQEPLGADFARVWDDNIENLYEW